MVQTAPVKSRRKYRRYSLVIALLLVVVLPLGWIFSHWVTRMPGTGEHPESIAETSFEQRFNEAIEAMKTGDDQLALGLWHALLLSNPEVVEIKVNLGFLLYEQQRYRPARDFFIAAIEQNAYQANAYYGLAICSEALGDLEGALGAMRSFVHLAEPDSPFLRKARAAIWEWESGLVARQPQPEN